MLYDPIVSSSPLAHSTCVSVRSLVIFSTLREESSSLISVRDDVNLTSGPQVSVLSGSVVRYRHVSVTPLEVTTQRVVAVPATHVNVTSSPGHISPVGAVND